MSPRNCCLGGLLGTTAFRLSPKNRLYSYSACTILPAPSLAARLANMSCHIRLVKEQLLRSTYVPTHLNAFEASVDAVLKKQHRFSDSHFHVDPYSKVVESFVLKSGHQLTQSVSV